MASNSRGICFVLAAFALANILALAEEPLAELAPRKGLANTFAKLEAGQAVRIAYLGGSITAQEGWRPQFLRWFQDQFPSAKISQINAAIGGTGSDLGVFRLKHDVLDQNPDLLFVEFAVNDSGAAPEQIHRGIEGIVRQTWKHNDRTDICFVYTVAGNMLNDLKADKLPRSIAAMEQVAQHYGIPTINMGLEVAHLERNGKLRFQGDLPKTDEAKAALGETIVFSPDGVHPFPETGHKIYTESIVRAMQSMRGNGSAGAHLIPAPLRDDNWEAAQMLPLSAIRRSAGWERLDSDQHPIAKRFKSRMPECWKATRAGERIAFKFRGTVARIYDLLGPDCGQVTVQVDDAAPTVVPRFDAYCTYHRLATLNLVEGAANTIHTIEITVHPDSPDKAKILSQRNEHIDDPKRFEGTAWYAGAVLLVGELAE